MTIYVFLGPTLSHQEAMAELDAVYLPPAMHGDVYRVSLENPQAIGLIDGYFEQVPSVWHKEILWVMKQGIHAYGSASMGALRAVELQLFGMEGVGTIFEWYRSGIIEGDDEVAVSHGSAADGYIATSTALVDIRATLRKAVQDGVLDEYTAASLEQIAKNLYYPQRVYPAVLQLAATQGLSPVQIETFREWLPNNKVDQKRDDALAMLRLLKARFAPDAPSLDRKQVRYTFQNTLFWDRARRRLEKSSDTGPDDHRTVLDSTVPPAPLGEHLIRSEKSSAYQRYCERVYGSKIVQFDMMDKEQLDKLLEVLKLCGDSRVLDLGCASGTLTEHISDRTGAAIIGIDCASVAVNHAQDRVTARNKAHRLRFLPGNMDNLNFLTGQFDAILAIDTLYFAKDLKNIIRQMKYLLKPDGQMGLFFSQNSPPNLDADTTNLARALHANDLRYTTYDFTDNERRFWQRSKQIAKALRPAFDAEGNTDLWEARTRESETNLINISHNKRYLYHVRIG